MPGRKKVVFRARSRASPLFSAYVHTVRYVTNRQRIVYIMYIEKLHYRYACMRASSSSPRFAETPVETFHLSAFQFKIRNFIAPRESERGDDAFISRIKVMGASSRARVHVIYIRSRQIAPALIFHAELAPPPTPPLLLHSFLLFLGAGDVKCRGLRGRSLLCKFGRDILRNCILVWELSREKE